MGTLVKELERTGIGKVVALASGATGMGVLVAGSTMGSSKVHLNHEHKQIVAVLKRKEKKKKIKF